VTSSSSTLVALVNFGASYLLAGGKLNRMRWESSSEEVSYSSASRFYRSSLRRHFYTDFGPFRP